MLKLSLNLQKGAPGLMMLTPTPSKKTNTHTDHYREEGNYSVGWGYVLEGGCCLGFNNIF